MNKEKLFLIQLNAIMFLMGYLLMHAFLSVVAGSSTRAASAIYNGVQLALSIYIMVLCRKDFIIEEGKSLLCALSVTMILYSLRMLFDVVAGPFSMILPQRQMLNDVVLTVGGLFFPTWAMICSRKYLDLSFICKGIFWTGLATCIFVAMSINMHGISFEEERVVAGRGLHSLALAKLGAIEFLVAIHMFMNEDKRKLLYLFGALVGGGNCISFGKSRQCRRCYYRTGNFYRYGNSQATLLYGSRNCHSRAIHSKYSINTHMDWRLFSHLLQSNVGCCDRW